MSIHHLMSAKKLLQCTENGHVGNIPGSELKYESRDRMSCIIFFVVSHRSSRKIHR